MSLNQVAIYGNLTRDPEVRTTTGGTVVCDLSIASNEKYRSKAGETVENVHYFEVTVFGTTAENCGKYLEKGRPVNVTGRLAQDRWEDKETGKNRSKVYIIANQVQFLGTGKSEGGGGRSTRREDDYDERSGGALRGGGSGGLAPVPADDDDIPF